MIYFDTPQTRPETIHFISLLLLDGYFMIFILFIQVSTRVLLVVFL